MPRSANSRPRKLPPPGREAFLELVRSALRVGLDLPERLPACLRVCHGAHVSLHLVDARAADLETPEVQVAVPADLLLDEAAPHLHRLATCMHVGTYQVIAVLS